ncbi:MAG: hypothetical protein JSV88_32550 [Candidatus Aminicenantes bacterium]|nr:MAG: hypothetical protein JSV88_32550 [Candidatus Aminicenantes bacterium]
MKFKYRLQDDSLSFEKGVEILKGRLPNHVFKDWPGRTLSGKENQFLVSRLSERGIKVKSFRVIKQEYREYLEKVNYKKRYPGYYPGSFHEKTLEHFIALKLLRSNLAKGRRFIDIGAESSPHSKIFSRLTGCKGYRQDIRYPKGVWWRKIGSDASSIPVKENFFHSALAACSIEHFENDSDIRFMKEMPRVLSIGGLIVVIPLYLHEKAFCATDPKFSVPGNVTFDAGIDIHCVDGWRNRHGRFYSPQTLFERLLEPNLQRMDFLVYYIENFKEIHESTYCRFALVGKKIA